MFEEVDGRDGDKPQIGRMRKAVCKECGLTLRVTFKWMNGRTLACPDINCGGHDYPLRIF